MRVAELRASRKAVLKATANRGIYPGSDLIDKRLHEWWLAFQMEAAKINIPLRVVWGFRTHAQQAELHRIGTGTRPGNSSHEKGFGIDVIHTTRAWERMPNEGWEILVGMGKEIARKQGLDIVSGANRKWGGDWTKGHDAAHWNLAEWRNEKHEPRSHAAREIMERL